MRPFTAWGFAGLLLHLFDPSSVLDPGFQLSFTAVLGLGASGPLSRAVPEPREDASGLTKRASAWARSGWSLFLQSAGATAGTAGFQSSLFGAVPVVGLFLNLLVIPLCTLFMAEAIFALALHATGVPCLASAGAGALDVTGILLLELNARGSKLLAPWLTLGVVPLPAILTAGGGLLFAWSRAESARGGATSRASATRWSAVALLSAALIPLAGALHVPWGSTPERVPVIEALDVGQGDATWVRLSRHRSILVDAGPRDESRDAGEMVIEPALREEGWGPIPVALLSHAHLDHFGGMEWLARRGWIRTLYENGSDAGGAWRRTLRAALRRSGGRMVPVFRDTALTIPGCGVLEIRRGLDSGKENDRSLAAVLHVGPTSILFAGDLESAGEASVLPRLSPVQVLKAPHHGSRTSSGDDWVKRLHPAIVLISCGERNRFGHPDPNVLDRYRRAGALVLRTDQEGAIRISLARSGAWVSTRRHPALIFVSGSSPSIDVTPSRHFP